MAKVEEIKTEFSHKTRTLKKSISETEKKIKERVEKYELTIKGDNFQAVYRKGTTRWDTKALEEYSKIHPEILQFRTKGKSSAIIIPVKNKIHQ